MTAHEHVVVLAGVPAGVVRGPALLIVYLLSTHSGSAEE